MSDSSGKNRIASLDGVRALAITLVVLGHAGAQLPPDSRFRFVLQDRGKAALGVHVFFVLSGYLITRLLLVEEDHHGRISLGRFYVRRAFRILPALYAYLAILALISIAGVVQVPGVEFLEAATFTWNYRGGGWWLGHMWSLGVEEQFYLFWPTLLALLGQSRAKIVALAVVGLEPAMRVGSYFALPSIRGFIPIMGHTNMDIIMFGCLLAMTDHSEVGRAWLVKRMTAWVALGFTMVLVVNTYLGNLFRGSYSLPIGYSVQSFSIAVLLFWMVHNSGTKLGRLLNWAPVAWLGRISYSLYIWQQFFLVGGIPQLPSLLRVGASVAAATLSYYLLEQPMLRVRDRVLARMRSRGADVGVAIGDA